MSRARATPEQIEATRPDRSNWVSANAGAGKTHVLTERVARLLLAGSEPQRILCLTYTKAAANEMQTRLFGLLGAWAMLDRDELALRLATLSGQSEPVTDPNTLAGARRLFARALETPGGLKIQTIHAFCETLLRRFPLEAGISPRFEVVDDRGADTLLRNVRTEMALAAELGQDAAFDSVAAMLDEDGLESLSRAILAGRAAYRVGDAEARIAARFGDAAGSSELEIAKRAMQELDPGSLADLIDVLAERGGKREQGIARLVCDWMSARIDDPKVATDALMGQLLTKQGLPRQRDLATKSVQAAHPAAVDEFARLTAWATRTRERLLSCRMAERTRTLYTYARPLTGRLDAAKSITAALDFDDLILRTWELLTRSDMRSWVLYKLDRGIDHILVDEAQDTSPQQWDLIAAIAEEFLSGVGARSESRSLFVVGDEKQSIYSFQGAEPRAFGEMRDHFASRLTDLGQQLGQPDLLTSFRSAPAILQFVDAVFQDDAAHGLTIAGTPPIHRAYRSKDQGRVDLWPLLRREETPAPPPWTEPVDAVPATDTKQRLAELVAGEITRMIGQERLPARADRPERLVRPSDILVLLTRRYPMAQSIIRGLKARGVPVAGSDRLSISKELAVKDLLALAKVALLPSDDLTLAALLRSPLCGVTEEELFDLAHGRQGTLWQTLQSAEGHAEVASFLKDMADVADYLRPYEFFERALIRHDGRRRLMARLGAEAEDPIDELLTQALVHERREVPTLAGFIAWIEAGGLDVKREMDRGDGKVRVMTVHGAKGLEAPIVIMPDTTSAPTGGNKRPLLLPVEADGNRPALMIWAGSSEDDDQVAASARAAREVRELTERKRLLYVALTRAEDWLILCGAEPGTKPKETWYEMLETGMAHTGPTQQHPSPTGEGQMLRFQTGPDHSGAPLEVKSEAAATPERLPDWVKPARPEPRVERRNPSDLVPHKTDGGTGLGRRQALVRGTAIHALLERLSGTPEERWPILASRVLESVAPDLDAKEYAGVIAEATAALSLPETAEFFGPRSLAEVSVAIDDRPSRPRMIGRIDRLLVTNDSVGILDIKSDALVPEVPKDVPESYLAQLGAYYSAIACSWPAHTIGLAILWTSAPKLMWIPTDLATNVSRGRLGSS